MTKREKRVKKLFTNPKSVSFEDLNRILFDHGFQKRQPRSRSSHFIYTKGDIQISIPFKRPYIKEVYIKYVIEIIGGFYEKGS